MIISDHRQICGYEESLWKGPIPFLMGIVGPFSYVLPAAALLLLLSEPLFGQSPGKLIVKIAIKDEVSTVPSLAKRWIRHLLKTLSLWLVNLALIVGVWQIALIAVFFAIYTFVNFLLSLGFKHQTFYDRIAKTHIVKLE